MLGISLLMIPGSSAWAQIKYNPDDVVIQEMAERAADFLATYTGSGAGSQAGGERVLCALTILEVSKRYTHEIPRDHPLIIAAVNEAVNMINGGGARNRLDTIDSMYYPCLASILLCEVDDEEYAPEIKHIVSWISERQNNNGGWGYEKRAFISDTSQSQYACLALFIAKLHKFKVNYQTAKRALDFLTGFQTQQGSWYYHYTIAGTAVTRNDLTPSLHCSGLGSVYLLADLLQLSPRSKNMSGPKGNGGLPPSVSIYIKPKPGEKVESKDKPLVSYDRGKITSTKAKGNRWLAQNFTVRSNSWNYYYLYALERYAFFREQAESVVGEIPDWYDQGVEYLMTQQRGNGSFSQTTSENVYVGTALATLFLIRSSQILVESKATTVMIGDVGFPSNNAALVMRNGQIRSQQAITGVADMLAMIGDSDGEDARALLEGAKITAKSIGAGMSRAQRMALLTGMVKDRNVIKRLIAIKVLAGEQNMDNVPALLYALGDPSIEVARKAHDGLRLVSRRIDAFPLGNNPTLTDFKVLKKRWTEWFLAIRPDAELID